MREHDLAMESLNKWQEEMGKNNSASENVFVTMKGDLKKEKKKENPHILTEEE